MKVRPRLLSHENVLALAALAGAAPAVAAAVWLLHDARVPGALQLVLIAILAGSCLSAAAWVRRKTAYPWRTMASITRSARACMATAIRSRRR